MEDYLKRPELTEEQVEELKTAIRQMESSGGKNLKHKTIQEGIHAGTRAIGASGLMPKTIQEMVSRKRKKGSELDELDKKILASKTQKNPLEIEELLKANPDKYEEYKDVLLNHVLEKQMNDPDKAMVAWHQGHNASPGDIAAKMEKMPEYMERFDKIKQDMGLLNYRDPASDLPSQTPENPIPEALKRKPSKMDDRFNLLKGIIRARNK